MSSVVVEMTARTADEACNIEIDVLHETLLKLPAEKYLELYKTMSEEIVKAYPPIKNLK